MILSFFQYTTSKPLCGVAKYIFVSNIQTEEAPGAQWSSCRIEQAPTPASNCD